MQIIRPIGYIIIIIIQNSKRVLYTSVRLLLFTAVTVNTS